MNMACRCRQREMLLNHRVQTTWTYALLWLAASKNLCFVDSFLPRASNPSTRRLDGLGPCAGLVALNSFSNNDDTDARSSFGTRQYWDDVYTGMGDFPKDEYSWYYGWDALKPHFTKAVPSKEARILLPGIGNDPILLDLWGAGYRRLTAFDYSEHAVERQQDLLSWEPKCLNVVQVLQRDARRLDPEWTDSFDVILEKGALDAIYLSGDGNVEQAVQELERVLRPGGILVSVSGVVPEELRRDLFAKWEWVRDGSDDLKAGCFVLKLV